MRRKKAGKKIVLLPGVGFHEDLSQYDEFLESFREEFGCETEIFNWSHNWNIPKDKLFFGSIRNMFSEVVLDFQQVIRHATEMTVPAADLYIGHSAGSILALCQMGKPCIIFGSPAMLVENIRDRYSVLYAKIIKSERPILNIVNKADVIAYTLPWANVENFYISPFFLNPFGLFTSHTSYWKDRTSIRKMLDTISKWGTLGHL